MKLARESRNILTSDAWDLSIGIVFKTVIFRVNFSLVKTGVALLLPVKKQA